MCFKNDSLWNSQGVRQHWISSIDRLIYHHSVYSDNILMCLSQGCDFWYQASHCLQYFEETPVTLQAFFFKKIPELSWQPLFGTLTYHFFLLLNSAVKAFTVHMKKFHHHFFDLMRNLYVKTTWSSRSAPPFACCSPQ